MSHLPRVHPELLEYLEKLYPDTYPTKSELRDEKAIWFKAGQVEVIRTLKNILEENSGNVLRKQTEDS